MTAALPGRLAVIGDIAGHWDELYAALVVLGMDADTLRLPDDLVVCQVGDLVHRGPDSDRVVAMVDEIMATQPAQWVQLIGNHEANEILPPAFHWSDPVATETVTTLRRWWERGSMRIAAAFEGVMVNSEPRDLLVTHAGLTNGLWRELGRPADAEATAALLNEQRMDATAPVWESGFLLGEPINLAAGPVWATSGHELLASWLEAERVGVPEPDFDQAHGHSSAFDWSNLRWRPPHLGEMLGERATIDRNRRILECRVRRQTIWGCDPGHGRTPARRWAPLVLNFAGA